jgi:pimeloyl-ACP methyl ester carboxylesterase
MTPQLTGRVIRIVDGVPFDLHAEASGKGTPTLLFMHYWGGSARTWRPVCAQLSARYRCLAYEHRGWGRSGAPADSFAIADLARDCRAIMDALAPAELVLVGHSMGGKVAQAVAASAPAHLRGVVLVAPAPAAPAVILDDRAGRQLLAAYTDADSVRGAIDQVLTHRPLSEALRTQIVEDSLAGTPAATAAWPLGAINEDASAGVGEIAVPVLIIGADHDVVEPVDLLREHVYARLPTAQLEVISDCGHLIPLEQPEQLASLIGGFVHNDL